MPAAEKQISFKCDEGTADLLGRLTVELDVNMSKIIRTCLILAIPMLRSNPFLVSMDNINTYRMSQSNKG